MNNLTEKSTFGSPRQSLTETLEAKLANPETSPKFDLRKAVNDVLGDVGLTVADGGGKLTFYGQDPIIASPFRFGSMAAIGLAAKSVAVAPDRGRPGHLGGCEEGAAPLLRLF